MEQSMPVLDWIVIGAYLAFLIVFAYWLSRSQGDREDYYVGGRALGAWPVAISIMATQCSTNSILGAPAFVAFSEGGGLVWLQYELALPLAMAILILFVMPVFRHLKLVSVYEYLEGRFDLKTRLALSGLFLFVRAFATAVTVYSIAIVIDLITGVGFFGSVVLLGVFTVVYDVLGGMRGVVYSDVIQMFILVGMLVWLLISLLGDSGGFASMLGGLDDSRRAALDFSHHGWGDGRTFAFWPMLFGGLFLYLSYYGCDQSQVQRELSTHDIDATNRALMINGFLRFPLVALYCLVGVGIAVFAADNPGFIASLPQKDGGPEYNLAVPRYMIESLPPGLSGLGLVALFAAAMSSLDSVLNSLSATTMEDFVRRFRKTPWSRAGELAHSRWITAAWGLVTLALAFTVGDIAPTVLEAINKIGSLANGPILAVFALGLFTRSVGGTAAIAGLAAGMLCNVGCWLFLPGVSWLWWNLIGLAVAVATAILLTRLVFIKVGLTKPALTGAVSKDTESGGVEGQAVSAGAVLAAQARLDWRRRCLWLAGWFVVLLATLQVVSPSG